MANHAVLSYLSDLYCRGSALQRVMVVWIAEEEFHILSLAAFLRAARVGVVERLLFDLLITPCKFHGPVLRGLFTLVKECFLAFFGFLTVCMLVRCWLLPRLRVYVRLTGVR